MHKINTSFGKKKPKKTSGLQVPTVTLLATVTLFCLTEGLAWDVGTGSLNSTHLFSLLSLRSLQREGNDGQGSNPRPHGPQPPCWDKEEELQTGCPRGPTRPCGRKKMQVISGWMDRRHMPGVGGRSWASRSFSVCPKVLWVTTAYVQLIQDGMTIYAKPQWVWPVAPRAPHLFFLSLASQRPLYVGGLGIGVFCSEGPNILHLGSPETPAQPAFCSPGH